MHTLNILIIIAKIFSCFAAVGFLFLTWRVICFIKNFQQLQHVQIASLENSNFQWPKISLIVPVCNEGSTVATAAQSLFSMDYPNIEFLFVNDRSEDNTPEVLKKLSEHEPRMKIITIHTLPQGWLGKVHAFRAGLSASKGEWVLFSDADVHYHRTSLKKAVFYALTNRLDFLGVLPSVVGGTFWVRVVLAQIIHHLALLANIERIMSPKYPNSAMAHGAFMLLSRSAYEKSRGFEWLKMEIVDDVGLAVEIKQSGGKVGVLGGVNEIDFEWYPTFLSLVRGFEKNTFAVFQYSAIILAIYILVVVCFVLGYTIAPIMTGSFVFMGFAWVSLAIYLAATAYSFCTFIQLSRWSVLLFPFTFLVLPFITVRAAVICLKQKGIYWRGTFYALDVIKKAQRLKMLNFFK